MPEIQVVTLNVCGLPSSLAPLPDRADLFCRTLTNTGADVLNFQEVWTRRALAVLRGRLPEHPHVAWHRSWAGYPSGGLATFSRRPVGAVRYTSFKGIRPASGGPRFRVKRAVNSLLQGVLTAELAGLGTVVANTHLTANKDGDWSPGNRYLSFQRDQLTRLHTALRRATTPGVRLTVVTGDFNVSSASSLYPVIVDGGAWHDPFSDGDQVTYHREFLPPGADAHRIDYLLSSDPAAVRGTGVLFGEPLALPDGRRFFVSDHVALTARLALP